MVARGLLNELLLISGCFGCNLQRQELTTFMTWLNMLPSRHLSGTRTIFTSPSVHCRASTYFVKKIIYNKLEHYVTFSTLGY